MEESIDEVLSVTVNTAPTVPSLRFAAVTVPLCSDIIALTNARPIPCLPSSP